MNFVTKKEFEDALSVIDKALKGVQVVRLLHESDKIELLKITFTDGTETADVNQVTFVAPYQAAKDELFKVRRELNKQKENVTKNQKILEELEQQERKLSSLLPTLKE